MIYGGFAVSEETDDVIVPLFRALPECREPEGLQGILFRRSNGDIALGAPPAPVVKTILDSNPLRNFKDYFDDMEKVGLAETSLQVLRLESSGSQLPPGKR